MSNIDLTQYGIKGTPKIYHNPSWDSPATKKARTPSLARLT